MHTWVALIEVIIVDWTLAIRKLLIYFFLYHKLFYCLSILSM